MDQTIQTLLNHRSIRRFENTPLTEEQIEILVKCAQSASTSSFIQAYSIIGVKDREKKEALAELAGNQSYVANNGHFFIFCADLYRHHLIGEREGIKVEESLESTEKFMVAVIDASLAAQNLCIAAESMGLGICYIGGLRNNLPEVNKLLRAPSLVLPLFGVSVGYPAQNPEKKPRLPFSQIYHENEYRQDEDVSYNSLEEYNEILSSYYKDRTNGVRSDKWTSQMAQMLSQPQRMYMKEFIENKNFGKR
ncbi:oxygen-insensitive NADPH nitroreductase [Bacillus lacus]|uniref:Oxygen-insensitive NADPH nitroreductase n=1 Tax=Metabacillus lacus TaxID=1983721 RepID=A0A7X2LW71_9BACI|nr:oxygen-insensitive NADPH nitroreductase [Metabacillus lacus]MRX71165.1 oxygen-insensitive NADPH nitroreductase [Metabacillus lacus]